ncbi:hypothetical protein PoB_003745400 [Plakobranchus ocellatus]|uniref:Uncharacterized protein n=1 Tax=Plakobranchus ocellatus TaxID=259542 RepID=A0AAV4AXT2_9GAST|nr:hypothetical protein PoB_003745400 [Plakobranchus ocellatus]
MISGFQAHDPLAGLEPAAQKSLQISGRFRYLLCRQHLSDYTTGSTAGHKVSKLALKHAGNLSTDFIQPLASWLTWTKRVRDQKGRSQEQSKKRIIRGGFTKPFGSERLICKLAFTQALA